MSGSAKFCWTIGDKQCDAVQSCGRAPSHQKNRRRQAVRYLQAECRSPSACWLAVDYNVLPLGFDHIESCNNARNHRASEQRSSVGATIRMSEANRRAEHNSTQPVELRCIAL